MPMTNRVQNEEARELYRAAKYCYKVERLYETVIIVMALLFSLASIFIKFIPNIAELLNIVNRYEELTPGGPSTVTEGYTNLVEMSLAIGKILSFVSGMWLILQIYLSYRANIRHKEGVNIEERYDVMVMGIEPNRNIMRPITGSMIRHYASRVKEGNDEKSIENKGTQASTIFNYQKEQFAYIHGLMIYARTRFFNFAWITYFVIIVGFSFFVDVKITDALSQIFFPSLSAISLIVSSMIKYNEQFRYNGNSLDCIKALEDEMIKEKRTSIPNSALRNIQDSLFISRLNGFSVPNFIARMYEKGLAKKNINQSNNAVSAPKKKVKKVTATKSSGSDVKETPKEASKEISKEVVKEVAKVAAKEVKTVKSAPKVKETNNKKEEKENTDKKAGVTGKNKK